MHKTDACVSSAGVILFFQDAAMCKTVQVLTSAAIPDYWDLGKGYGKHVFTIELNLNKDVQEWRKHLTMYQLSALEVKSEYSVGVSLTLSRLKKVVQNFPPVALIGMEAADPPKYPTAVFSLFNGNLERDEDVQEGALRQLFEESTIKLHEGFFKVRLQGHLRQEMGFPDFPLYHQIGWGVGGRRLQHLYFIIVPDSAQASQKYLGGRRVIHIFPCDDDKDEDENLNQLVAKLAI